MFSCKVLSAALGKCPRAVLRKTDAEALEGHAHGVDDADPLGNEVVAQLDL